MLTADQIADSPLLVEVDRHIRELAEQCLKWRQIAERLGEALENFDYCGYEEANAALAEWRAMESPDVGRSGAAPEIS
jgi:hypothetical protein